MICIGKYINIVHLDVAFNRLSAYKISEVLWNKAGNSHTDPTVHFGISGMHGMPCNFHVTAASMPFLQISL